MTALVIDPSPRGVTASTGYDFLAHACGPYTTTLPATIEQTGGPLILANARLGWCWR